MTQAKKMNGSHANGKKTTAVTPKTAKTTAVTKVAVGANNVDPEELLKQIRNTVFKTYGIRLPLRDQRKKIKIGHAIREMMGLDIAAQLKKNQKSFDWNKWNTKVFPALFGSPDALKYDVETIAAAIAMIYDRISENPEQGTEDLIEFNRKSLERRNSFNNKDDELEEVDEELDELSDEDDDELEDEEEDEDLDLEDEELEEE